MSTPGFIFFVMFVVFISTLGGLALWKLFDIVRNSIKTNKTSGDDERFDRLAKAFIKYKKDSEQRLKNLEATITDKNTPRANESSGKKLGDNAGQKSIEINQHDPDRKKQRESNGGNLRNMLKD